MKNLDADRLPACPRCGGPHSISGGWVDSLTWRHDRACPLYERDSATAAADHERGRGHRPMTDTEAELTRDQYETPPDGHTLGVKFRHGGVHRRRVYVLAGDGSPVRPARRRGGTDVG